MNKDFSHLKLFSTSANPELMEKVADRLGIDHGRYVRLEFANHNSLPRLLTDVNGSKVFIMHTFAPEQDVEREFAEFKKLIRAAKEYGAKEVVAVIEYFSYGRSHRQKPRGVPLAAKLYAEEVKNAGADKVVIIVLHNLEIIPYFGVPVVHLGTKHLIMEALSQFVGRSDTALLSPDEGRAERLRSFAQLMGLSAVYGKKERTEEGKVKFFGIKGKIKNRLICIDDEINTGGTAEKLFLYLLNTFPKDLKELIFAVTHAVLCGGAIKKLSGILEMAQKQGVNFKILLTDTLPIPATKKLSNMEILSVAPMLAEVIRSLYLEKEVTKYLY